MKTPHLLLAAPNTHVLRDNLVHLLSATAIASIDAEITANVVALFRMGEDYLKFAKTLSPTHWRHKISRLYYAAYAVSRSVRLRLDGEWSMSPGEHKKVGALPASFPNQSMYANRLSVLRDDRNLADYDHACTVADLVINLSDAESLVEQLVRDSRTFLAHKGIIV